MERDRQYRRGLRFRAAALVLVSWIVCNAGAASARPVEVEMFTRRGCSRCAAAERFLDSLRRERPDLRVVVREIDRDPRALEALRALAARKNIAAIGVPAFVVGETLLIGFASDATSGARLRALIDGTAGEGTEVGEACTPDSAGPCSGAEPVEPITVPLLGPVAPHTLGLPLFTIVLGLLDGFNPCAMWVLLFLLSLLVNVRSRARMLAIAGGFVAVSGAVYFAFMAAWLNVFALIGFSTATRAVLGVVAALVGLIDIKDGLAVQGGFSLAIPERAKPRLYAAMRRVLHAENLTGALASVVVLAVLANTVELLCTAGFPAVYTRILSLEPMPRWSYFGYLALYNAAYMLDDGIMVAIAVATMRRFKLQERGGRILKLVSGAVLLGLGLALLAKPEWLSFPLTSG